MSNSYVGSSSSSQSNVSNVTFPEAYPYTVKTTDFAIFVDTTQPREIDLPVSPLIGERCFIVDNTGEANVNPITIEGNGNTINQQTSYTIQSTFGFIGLIFNGQQWNVTTQ